MKYILENLQIHKKFEIFEIFLNLQIEKNVKI